MDTGTGLLRVNQSKLCKAYDDWYDMDVPLEDEAVGDSHHLSGACLLAEAEHGDDIQELCVGPMHLSSACATTCLRVARPLDLCQEFDLNSQPGQQ